MPYLACACSQAAKYEDKGSTKWKKRNPERDLYLIPKGAPKTLKFLCLRNGAVCVRVFERVSREKGWAKNVVCVCVCV